MLTTIPAYAFKNLLAINATRIHHDLQINHISNIESHAFNGVETSVTYLNLENNNLTHLPLALTELSSLRTLNLLRNPLVKLDALVLANISSSLNIFYVYVGKFSSFPNKLHFLTALSQLTINNLTFPIINSTVFHSFEHYLNSLHMSYADFESIPTGLCRLKSLESFTSKFSPSLSRCESSIFDACNHSMTSITSLTLQFDKLATIPNKNIIMSSFKSSRDIQRKRVSQSLHIFSRVLNRFLYVVIICISSKAIHLLV